MNDGTDCRREASLGGSCVTRAPRQRDVRLDLLRGLFLAVMMLNHLPRFPRALWLLTVDSYGFFAGASGFVFISGFLAARTYGRTIDRSGLAGAAGRALVRAGQIYAMHMTVFLFALALAQVPVAGVANLQRFMPLFVDEPVRALWEGALLRYRPPFLNILPVFLVFALMTPLLVAACRRGLRVALVAASLGLWALAQPAFLGPLAVESVALTGPFDLLGWQPLFVIGVVLGTLPPTAGARLDAIGGRLFAPALYFCVACLVARWALELVVPDYDEAAWVSPIVGKVVNGPLRLANFAAAVLVVSRLRSSWFVTLAATLPGRFLVRLGRHSLQVFGWSVAVTYASLLILRPWYEAQWPVQVLLAAVCVCSLVVPCALHERYQRARRSQAMTPAARSEAMASTE